MIQTLLGTKKAVTSSYDARGRRVGATVISLGPNMVTAIKHSEGPDGYEAVQLGFGVKKTVRKPQLGHFKKANIDQKLKHLKEVRIKDSEESEGLSLGQEIKVGNIFKVGDAVKVTGTSKGRGFQGGVRRFNFRGGPKTHGQSDRHRAPGSIGAGTTPGRVYRGKKMAGHMGVTNVSYIGVEVLAVDRTNNLLTIKGGVPGAVGGLVIVEKQGQIKGYTPPPEEKPDEEEEEKKEAQGQGSGEESPKKEKKVEWKSEEDNKEETGQV